MKKAVLLVSHGSRLPEAKQEVAELARLLKRRTKMAVFEYAFLEINHPNIAEGIRICAGKGATEITILLNFLNSGNHVRRDIPNIVDAAKKEFPHVKFRLTIPIGQHKGVPLLFMDILKSARSL